MFNKLIHILVFGPDIKMKHLFVLFGLEIKNLKGLSSKIKRK